jgi:hypothetical protein
MSNIDPSSIALAAITYYPKWYSGPLRSIKHTDKIRGDLAIEFCKKAREIGYQVVIVDGKSTATFKKEIAKISGVRLVKRRARKRSPNKRQAIFLAASIPGVKVIIQTEAEKVSIVTDGINKIAEPLLSGQADIVIPKREEKLFRQSYPSYMYDSEVEGNKLYNEGLRAYGILDAKHEDLDLFFGPRAYKNSSQILRLLKKRYHIDTHNLSFPSTYFDLEELSNAQFFPFILALKKGLKVVSVEIPFVYPKIQKDNEEKGERALFLEKRKAQRLSLIVEMLHFLSYLDKNPASRLKTIR